MLVPKVAYAGIEVVTQKGVDLDLIYVGDLKEKIESISKAKSVRDLFVLDGGSSMHSNL